MPGKSRILLVSTAYLPEVGGSELAIKHITDRLPDFTFDLITSRPERALPAQERIGAVNIHRVGSWGLFPFLLPKNLFPLFVFFKAWQLMHQRGPYRLIHAFQASPAAGGGWLFKWFYPRIPFVITVQEGKALNRQPWLMRFFRRLIFQKADQATVISRYLAQYVYSQNPRLPVKIIPNGVAADQWGQAGQETAALRQTLGLKGSDRVVLTASRLVEKNGLADLLAAFALLCSNLPDAKLIIIGSGPLAPVLKRQSAQLQLSNDVKWLGTVEHQHLPAYFQLADVFVRPSLSEGLGTAFLEAMAAGLPIIGTPVGGIPDFLQDGETGLFCRVNDPADLAEKISRLLADPELRRRLQGNGQRLVRERYDWEQIASQFGQLYSRV